MKNCVQNGDRITLAVSSVSGPHTTSGTPKVYSGDPIFCKNLVGVAVADANSTAEADPNNAAMYLDTNVVMQLKGVFQLSVHAYQGNLGVGDTVYISSGVGRDGETTGELSDDYTQVPFGTAIDAAAQGATTSIRVRLFGAVPGTVAAYS